MFLSLACTLSAARVLDAGAALLGVSHDRPSELAFGAARGAGTWFWRPIWKANAPEPHYWLWCPPHGPTGATATPEHIALADAVDAMPAASELGPERHAPVVRCEVVAEWVR
jgi:xylulokinase